MVSIWYFVVGGVSFGLFAIALFFFFMMRSWKIPVVSFKLVGDKRRPVLDLTRRAKIVVRDGVKHLKFRGTPDLWEMKNFKNEDYYLTNTGQPALVVFEFAKDCFAPVKPVLRRVRRLLGRDDPESVAREVPVFVPVDFVLGEKELEQLLLRAVDDFDPAFILRNFGRIDRQFTGGIRAFLHQFGSIIGLVLISVIMLVSIVLFFQKSPELAAACGKAAVDTASNFVENAARSIGGPAA